MADYDAKETQIIGHVKWFNTKSGYGFIKRDEEGDDVFVHYSSITAENKSLADGEEVLFDVIEGAKGLEARNVTGPDGGNVQGSKQPLDYMNNRPAGGNQRGGNQRGGYRGDYRNQPYARENNYAPRRDGDRQGGDFQFGRYDNDDSRSRRPQGQTGGYGNPRRGFHNDGGSGGRGGYSQGGRGGYNQGGAGGYNQGGYENRSRGGYRGGDNNYE